MPDSYRVFAQSANSGKSFLQCCVGYREAHEQAACYRASGLINVKILPDRPSLDHVRIPRLQRSAVEED